MARASKYNSPQEALVARNVRRRERYHANPVPYISSTKKARESRKLREPFLDSRLYRERLAKFPRWNEQVKLSEYGLTLEEYDMRIETQGGVCIICGNSETNTINGKVRKLPVDHVPGKPKTYVRDLPCSNCNRGLGLFRDNPEYLRTAADYLERWNKIYE